MLVYVPDRIYHRYLPADGVTPAKYINDLTGWTTRGVGGFEPSHWMELPEPPENPTDKGA